MLKRISLACALLMLAATASADITLLSPENVLIPPSGRADIGAIQPGDTLLLSFSNKTGYGEEVRWNNISRELSVLPAGWELGAVQQNELTLTAEITAPKNAVPNPYNLKIAFESNSAAVPPESVNLRVLVAENLLQASMANLKQDTIVNEPAVFVLVLDNTASAASHKVVVLSTLSNSWFEPRAIEVKAGEIKNVDITVVSQYYGTTPFVFTIQSLVNGSTIATYDAEINARPTLVGKYSAALSGFPVFSTSLVPYYMINALLSLIFT